MSICTKLDKDSYKIDWILIPYSKWKQIGVFHFVIENKISVVFCLETSRLSFVLKTISLVCCVWKIYLFVA